MGYRKTFYGQEPNIHNILFLYGEYSVNVLQIYE